MTDPHDSTQRSGTSSTQRSGTSAAGTSARPLRALALGARADTPAVRLARAVDESAQLARSPAEALAHIRAGLDARVVFVDADADPDAIKALAAHAALIVCAPAGGYCQARVALEAGGEDVIFATASAAEARLRAEALASRRARATRARDPITGLRDRRDLARVLPDALARAHADGASCGVLLADVDRLKALNDSYGHLAGDLALARMGQALARLTGGEDEARAWRFGGDEFVAVFPGARAPCLATAAESLRAEFARDPLALSDEARVQVTVSVGGALARAEEGVDALLARADAAMYRAKLSGRDSVALDMDDPT